MKIVIDRAIPFIEGLFERYSEVIYLEGGEFTPELIRDADALIIRTRTKCNEALLAGSQVSYIATATIGYDHIDMNYCHSRGIVVTTAQGCNARGVLQWVAASLALLSKCEGWQPKQRCVGIVGVGNVGRLIKEYATAWGFDVVCCDPPRVAAEGIDDFVEFDELLSRADIVSFHTPLSESTRHMLNEETIKLLRPNAAILNTSRGEVVDSSAIANAPQHRLLFDVWEHEPNISRELLERATVSTPHIAGYSLQGKANGSAMVVGDIAQHFSLPIEDWYPEVEHNRGAMIEWDDMCQSIRQHFDIEAQSQALKSAPREFESMRNGYSYRQEYF